MNTELLNVRHNMHNHTNYNLTTLRLEFQYRITSNCHHYNIFSFFCGLNNYILVFSILSLFLLTNKINWLSECNEPETNNYNRINNVWIFVYMKTTSKMWQCSYITLDSPLWCCKSKSSIILSKMVIKFGLCILYLFYVDQHKLEIIFLYFIGDFIYNAMHE